MNKLRISDHWFYEDEILAVILPFRMSIFPLEVLRKRFLFIYSKKFTEGTLAYLLLFFHRITE